MSKIKAVHSRFSYYITWGKEIGDAKGENSKEERNVSTHNIYNIQSAGLKKLKTALAGMYENMEK